MTTLHCAIYEDVSPPSQYVYYFFEAKKIDDFGFFGWAKCKKSPEEGRIPQPIETGFYCIPNESVLPLIMPEEVLIICESIPTSTPQESSDTATAEINEHEARIYKDGELWLTLTQSLQWGCQSRRYQSTCPSHLTAMICQMTPLDTHVPS